MSHNNKIFTTRITTPIELTIKIEFANKKQQEIKGLTKEIFENDDEKVIILKTEEPIEEKLLNKHITIWTLSINASEEYNNVLIYFIKDKNNQGHYDLTVFKKNPQPTSTELQPDGKNKSTNDNNDNNDNKDNYK